MPIIASVAPAGHSIPDSAASSRRAASQISSDWTSTPSRSKTTASIMGRHATRPGRIAAVLDAALEKMRRAGVPEPAQEAFARMYAQLDSPDAGVLPGDRLEPVRDVPRLDDLDATATSEELDRAIVIKLNGGLGTSMGLSAPKSLIEVKPGWSFLDVIARQVLALRERHGIRL